MTGEEAMLEPTTAVLFALERFGILLKQDKRLPNVVTIVTGDAPSTSWWSHPKGNLIFRVLDELSDHPDVLFTKLISGKDTLVHRSLWPALLAVASSGEAWQRRGLSASARQLLDRVRRAQKPLLSSGPAVKELTTRLLVNSVQVHTESGQHQTALETWSLWSHRNDVNAEKSLSMACSELEHAGVAVGAPLKALPWQSGHGGRR
jgi:hypothetical protein